MVHHQNRLGFRQLRGDLVQEVPADVPNPAVQPGQTQHGLLVVARENRPLPLFTRFWILLHHRLLLLP
jgi:hypothetical protein